MLNIMIAKAKTMMYARFTMNKNCSVCAPKLYDFAANRKAQLSAMPTKIKPIIVSETIAARTSMPKDFFAKAHISGSNISET